MTKRETIALAQEILHRTELGSALDGEAFDFVRALIDRHPNVAEKIGAGVKSIRVRPAIYGQRCFVIERADGSETDFSYRKCVFPTASREDLHAALRTAIRPQVIAALEAAFAGVDEIACPISGELITRAKAHVDHTPPRTFAYLVKAFLAECVVDSDGIEIYGHGDGEMEKRLASEDLETAWTNFHRRWAVLRVISAAANTTIMPAIAREVVLDQTYEARCVRIRDALPEVMGAIRAKDRASALRSAERLEALARDTADRIRRAFLPRAEV